MGEKEAEKVVAFLRGKGVAFEVLEHAPVYTSADAARVRGFTLGSGVKAMVLELPGGELVQADLAADKKIDFKAFAALVGVHPKKLKLASPEKVFAKTGCEIGSVHPLGHLNGLKVYLDESVKAHGWSEFNIGVHTRSVRMKCKDFLKVVEAFPAKFSR